MPFLQFVAEGLYKQFNGDFLNLTVVLPTRRAGLFLKDHLGELSPDKPICLPQCTTISDLTDSLCPLKAADEIESVCMLYEIYDKLILQTGTEIKPMSLDVFYGWGRQLINDFNNVDKNYRDSTGETIFKSASEARHFDENKLDDEVRMRLKELLRGTESDSADDESFRKHFELIWSKMPDIYTKLTEQLKAKRCALEGARIKWVVDNFESEVLPSIEDRTFAFVGFNILLGAEKELLELLQENDKAIFFWDHDKALHDEEEYFKPYKHTAKNLDSFGGEYEDSPTNGQQIELIATTSDNEQARYVYEWLGDHHKNGEKTAIVLCDETMLQPVVFSLPNKQSGNINITHGYPLKHTQVYATILDSLRQAAKKAEGKTDVQYFTSLIGEIADKIEGRNSSVTPATTRGMEWYDLLHLESVYQARCVLIRFQHLLDDGQPLNKINNFNTLRMLLLRHFETINMPFHGEPITDIQVIGMLETRTLDFDNVLMLNVEEGIVPLTSNDTSFIPYYLRKYYSLTTNDEQTEAYSYNFFRLLRRAKHITMMYSEAQTALRQKTMSRFILQILCSEEMARRATITRHKLTSEAVTATAEDSESIRLSIQKLSEQNLSKRPTLPGKRKDRDELKLSPSAINTYLRCKMQFFIKYMLGLKETTKPDVLMPANDIGTIIHDSVTKAYTIITQNQDGTGHVSSDQIKDFLCDANNIDVVTREAFEDFNANSRKQTPKGPEYDPDKHMAEYIVIKRQIQKILEYDSQQQGLNILGHEIKTYLTLQSHGLAIKTGGSIDRLDQVTVDGKITERIVDYKTGKYDKDKNEAASLDALFKPHNKHGYILQTMTYALARTEDEKMPPLNHPLMPVLIFSQKDLDSFDPRLKIGDAEVADFASQHKEEFEKRLQTLVDEIVTQNTFSLADLDNSNCPCGTCAFALLCNRQDVKKSF